MYWFHSTRVHVRLTMFGNMLIRMRQPTPKLARPRPPLRVRHALCEYAHAPDSSTHELDETTTMQVPNADACTCVDVSAKVAMLTRMRQPTPKLARPRPPLRVRHALCEYAHAPDSSAHQLQETCLSLHSHIILETCSSLQ